MELIGILVEAKVSTRTIAAPGISSGKRLTPHLLTLEQIPAWWGELEPLLQKSVDRSQGTITLEGLGQQMAMGSVSTFVTLRDNRIMLVLVIGIVEYETFHSARILAMAGTEVREAAEFLPELVAWALTRGAIEIEGWCRPAVVRLVQRLGFKPKFTICTLDLRGKLQ